MIGNKVLVPLDGSVMATRALDCAPKMLSNGGTLYLLSVMDRGTASIRVNFHPTSSKTHLEVRQSYLKSLVQRLEVQGLNAIGAVEIGDPVDLIVTKSRFCDLVIMTARGWHDAGTPRYGHVTQSVLESSRCPVAVVPVNRFEAVEVHDPKTVPAG